MFIIHPLQNLYQTLLYRNFAKIANNKHHNIIIFYNLLLTITYMKEKLSPKDILIGIFGGVFVGFLSGFFGGGGGMIVVPLLIFALGLAEKEAHATAIFTILPISIASSIVYIARGSVNYLQLLYATIGFVLGGAIGAILLNKMNNTLIRVIFAIIMIAVGLKIIL